jgi:pimeloyl-ACP methyl ester carboxylesterase
MTGPTAGSLRRRAVALVLACAAAAMAGCSDEEPAAAPAPTATPSADVAGRFDVGGGRMLQITCTGRGEPTILLEAGGGSSSSDYPFAVRSALAAKTRTCTYDRAGLGASDPSPYRRRLMVDVVTDLDHLLAAAGIKGELLLVGASFGGLVVLDFALTHPERTAGLVVLDTDWPTADRRRSPDKLITPAQRAEYIRLDAWDNPPNIERIDYQATNGEVERRVHPLSGIPVVIVTAAQSFDCEGLTEAVCTRNRAEATRLQRQWLQLSPTAVQRVVDTSHDLVEEDPDAVVSAILAALADARS